MPQYLNEYSGLLAIIGGGKAMWQELELFKELAGSTKYDTMAVNISSMMFPDLTHMYSLHYKNIGCLKRWREVEYGEKHKPNPTVCHSSKDFDGVDHVYRMPTIASTSGLMATVLADALGYDKFVLIGVPMDGSGYYYKPSLNEAFPDRCRGIEIQNIKEKFDGRVKSMSGRTRDSFGQPTAEWIRENKYAKSI